MTDTQSVLANVLMKAKSDADPIVSKHAALVSVEHLDL